MRPARQHSRATGNLHVSILPLSGPRMRVTGGCGRAYAWLAPGHRCRMFVAYTYRMREEHVRFLVVTGDAPAAVISMPPPPLIDG